MLSIAIGKILESSVICYLTDIILYICNDEVTNQGSVQRIQETALRASYSGN